MSYYEALSKIAILINCLLLIDMMVHGALCLRRKHLKAKNKI